MAPALYVAAAWLLFIASHIGLTVKRVREPLVRRFGQRGFIKLFTAIAALLFAALVIVYARERFDGAPGLGLGAIPWLRTVLIGAIGLGVTLMIAAFAPRAYWDSPI